MKNNDVDLIERVLSGDETAFTELVKKYQKPVHALAWRKIGDFHIAEEITQDTFLKAYQRLHTLKDPHRFAGWLYVIANRRCLAWFRKERIQVQPLENMDSVLGQRDAYSQHVATERAKTANQVQQDVVKKLLMNLKESDRTIIILHYFGEMTCEEMSKFLGVSVNTVKSRLRRARNRLKKEETVIREALDTFKISPNLTDTIIQEVARLKPGAPASSKPLVPWMLAATSAVLIVLVLGIGSQHLSRFQRPYSLDAQSEMKVDIIDAPIVHDFEAEPDARHQPGKRSDTPGRDDGNGEKSNQVFVSEGDYTRWNLPEGAKRRLGKGVVNDMQLSPDGKKLAIASSTGIWLYDVSTGKESALRTKSSDFARLVVFSPDSKVLVSAGSGNKIQSWDVDSGKPLLTLTVPREPLFSLKFLADGKTLMGLNWPDSVDIYREANIWFWDITTGAHLKSFNPEAPIVKIAGGILTGGLGVFVDKIGVVTYAIGNKNGTISIQNGQTDREIITLVPQTDETDFFTLRPAENVFNVRKPRVHGDDKTSSLTYRKDNRTPFPIQYQLGPQSRTKHTLEAQPMRWITALDFAPDGKTLVNRCDYMIAQNGGLLKIEGPIEIWDVDTGEQLAALDLERVSDVKCSSDGKTLAIIGYDGCVLWDIPTRQKIGTFPQSIDVRFSGDGKTVCILSQARYMMWNIAARKELAVLNYFEPFPERFVLSHDGAILTTLDAIGTVNVWETETGKQLRILTTGWTKEFTALAFAPDGKTLASGDNAGNIQLWRTDTHTKRMTIKAGNNRIDGLAFAPDNRTLTTMSRNVLKVWDAAVGKQREVFTIPNATSGGGFATFIDGTRLRGKSLALTSNSERLAITAIRNPRNNFIEVWDIATGKPPQRLMRVRAATPGLQTIALTSDGNMLAHYEGNTVSLWNANTGTQFTKLELSNDGHAIGFSPDGKTLGVGLDRGIQLYDVKTHRHIGTLAAHEHTVCKLAFSPDGTILATGDTGGKIHLWDIPTRRHLTIYDGHGSFISALAFTPDSKMLASISGGSYRYYNIQDGTILLWNVPSK